MFSGEEPPKTVDKERLNSVLDRAFSEPNPNNRRLTRAVVVVYDGQIVAERYAPDITKDTPLLGYGMTMSVINALTGILVGRGALELDSFIADVLKAVSGDDE